jgi:hypothetical protein
MPSGNHCHYLLIDDSFAEIGLLQLNELQGMCGGRLNIKIDASYFKHLERTIKQDHELLRGLQKQEGKYSGLLESCMRWYSDEEDDFYEDKLKLL